MSQLLLVCMLFVNVKDIIPKEHLLISQPLNNSDEKLRQKNQSKLK